MRILRFRSPLALLCVGLFLVSTAARAVVLHPLDPLEDTEILAAATILLDGGAAIPGAVFQSVDLHEPSKTDVLAFHPGDTIPRAATVFFRQEGKSYRTVVDLTAGTYSPLVEIPIGDGQLGLTIQEILDFSYAFEDPALLDALAARGIDTSEELANVFIQPLTAGSFGLPEESKRIVKGQLLYIEGASTNFFARPIEGIQAVLDLDAHQVLEVIDTGVIPIQPHNYNFDEATIDAAYGLRSQLKPIEISQPEGSNVTFDGNFVEWQKWRFHVRFERRSGTIVSLVTYDGRSVMYQGSLAEAFVPYQDPDVNWYYRTFMDAGEFGFGALASPLTPGLDVPPNAVLLGAVISAAIPDPVLPVVPLPLDDVVGIFERRTGNPEWRHFEFLSGLYEGRAAVELVVRTIAQVGNYDYMVDWIFTQSGAIRVEVHLTGIDIDKGVVSASLDDPTAAADTAHGTLVAPYLVAPFHSHHFNFRLDMDVDGTSNSFVRGKLETQNVVGSPRKSVWVLKESVLPSERAGQLDDDESVWRIVNPSVRNALGYNTGYVLESHANGEPLLRRADYERARFIGHDLWVTAFHPDERYAAGDTPNQNPGEPGLPQYVANNESLVNADLVLWHTLTFHHVTAAEDFPVLSLEEASFELKPANFFDRNPALDLRRAPFE
jgi:primary-amine oxidase